MPTDRDQAASVAKQKFIEAAQWWESFHRTVHTYRCWAVIYAAYRRRCLEIGDRSGSFGRVLDAAHDMMLVQVDKLWSASRCAVAAELAGRIYLEKHEEREVDVDKSNHLERPF
jgi:hypothetical protein